MHETIIKHNIEWNIHHANDIETNPIDFLYCFQGDSTREHVIRVYKVECQYPVDEDGISLYSDDFFQAQYYILYTLLYTKQSELYDPYGENWYLNYTTIDQIADDYNSAQIFETMEDLENNINSWVHTLTYMLSYIADSAEDAKEAAEKTKILDIAPHILRYDGYQNYNVNPDSLEDIAWYFNEFASSIGILSTKIIKDMIHFNLDRNAKVTFRLKNGKGYLKHWRTHDKAGTICKVTTQNAFEAVQWLLFKAYHKLPLRDKWDAYEDAGNTSITHD